jgi:hypothetical protein
MVRRMIAPRILAALQLMICARRLIEGAYLGSPAVGKQIRRVHQGRGAAVIVHRSQSGWLGDSAEEAQ